MVKKVFNILSNIKYCDFSEKLIRINCLNCFIKKYLT